MRSRSAAFPFQDLRQVSLAVKYANHTYRLRVRLKVVDSYIFKARNRPGRKPGQTWVADLLGTADSGIRANLCKRVLDSIREAACRRNGQLVKKITHLQEDCLFSPQPGKRASRG